MGLLKSVLGGVGAVVGGVIGFSIGGPLGAVQGALIGLSIGSVGGSAVAQLIGITPRRPTAGDLANAQPIASAAQILANAEDAEYPRTLVMGERLVGYSKIWVGTDDINTGDKAVAMVSGVVCDHPIDSFEVIQIGDLDANLTTHFVQNLGEFNGGTYGLPDSWYIPSSGNRYRRQFEGEPNGPVVWHAAFRLFTGGQTSSEGEFNSRSSSYAARNRVLRGLTYFNSLWIANTALSFGGRPPDLAFRVKGKDDVWDPRSGGSNAWTRNAALNLVEYMKWRLGFVDADFDSAALEEAADDCEAAIPGEAGTAKFYIDAVVRTDEDPEQVIAQMLEHMAGVMYEQNGKWVIKVGKPRAPVAALTEADQADGKQPIFLRRLTPDKRINTLTPHVIVQKDENGREIYQPKALKPITDPAWVANDGGQVLESDLRLPYCVNDKRGKYVTWIVAQEARLEATLAMTFKVNSRTLTPRLFDVVTYTNPELGLSETEFRVDAKVWNFQENTVDLLLREYDDAIYTPGALDDEPVGALDNDYDGIPDTPILGMPTVITGSGAITGTGATSMLQVRVPWTRSREIWVAVGGGYQLRWREKGSGDAYASTTTDGSASSKIVNLISERTYEFELRARTQFGVLGDWAMIEYTVPQQEGLPGPPIDAGFGENLIPDWNFERGGIFVGASWELTNPNGFQDWILFDGTWNDDGVWHDSAIWYDTGSPAPNDSGSVQVVEAGRISPNCLSVTAAGTAPEPFGGAYDFRARPTHRANVTEGQLYYCAAYGEFIDGTVDDKTQMQLEVLWYTKDFDFVSATIVESWSPSGLNELHWLHGYAQAPQDEGVAKARAQIVVKWNEDTPDNCTFYVHGVILRRSPTTGKNGPGTSVVVTSSSLSAIQDAGILLYAPPEGSRFEISTSALLELDSTLASATAFTASADLSRYPDGSPGSRTVLKAVTNVSAVGDEEVTPFRYVKLTATDTPPVASGTQYVYELRGAITDTDGSSDWDAATMEVRII